MASDPVPVPRPRIPAGPPADPTAIMTKEDIGPPRPIKEFVWEEKPRLLKDVLSTSRLPFTAKLHTGDIGVYVPKWADPEGVGTNGEEILQVMETTRRKAVVVRKMQWNRQTGDYAICGSGVEIPATYKGWFEVLPDDGRPVEYFDSIQAITNVKPRRFLVRTATVGYQLSVESSVSTWVPYEIRPGAVLTTGIVFMDQKKSRTNVKNFFRKLLRTSKGSKKEQELKYLQCFDTSGTEVMIPIIMSGVFSPIGETAEENFDSVYELQDLILAFNMPVKAQLIHEEDQEGYLIVPHGIVTIEEVRDTEWVVFGRYPLGNGNEEMFELPINADIHVQKDISRKRKTPKRTPPKIENLNKEDDPDYINSQKSEVELPVRVKEQRKGKAGLFDRLDKLSVRSRTRKERASLKALQEAGVFSSRLSKSEMSFDDFNTIDHATENEETENATQHDPDDADGDKSDKSSTIDNDDRVTYTSLAFTAPPYGTFAGSTVSPQNRDLPPIPNSPGSEKEALYEELPLAPHPPPATVRDTGTGLGDASYSLDHPDSAHPFHGKPVGTDANDEDGYMSPAQLRMKEEQEHMDAYSIPVRNKPPVPPIREAKLARARKAKNEVPSNPGFDYRDKKETNETEIDELFRFNSENDKKFTNESPYASRDSRTTVNAQTSQEPSTFSYESAMMFVDDQRLETRSNSGMPKFKSRSHRSLNFDANATVRSHNIRRMKNAVDVFNFTDSFHDIRQDPVSTNDNDGLNGMPPGSTANSMVNTGDRNNNPYSSHYGRAMAYAESEPAFKQFTRSASISGISEALARQADESAISGDYGYHGDSEYSYQEYSDYRDDRWIPPDNLSQLTVEEVSKSLHYIGMKDRVVIRLANEQIDGSLLCSLDKQLLKEGFPELNGLDVKKIVDFINGWRPKKK